MEFCLLLPRESLSIPVMRRVLGDTLTRLGVDQASVDDLLLAVTEACTNVLLHAGPGRRYELIAHVSATRCLVEVLDDGGFDPAAVSRRRIAIRHAIRTAPRMPAPRMPGQRRGSQQAQRSQQKLASQPTVRSQLALRNRIARTRRAARDRAVSELPESGRGLAIMRACVDDVTMETSPGEGTVVSLRKRIVLRDGTPLAQVPGARLRDAG